MACGSTVFLSQCPSLPEIGAEEAFYFDNVQPESMAYTIKEGLTAYNQQPILYFNRLKNRATAFDYRIMAQNYLDLYNHI